MRSYQTWVVVAALLAATPGTSSAGLPSFLKYFGGKTDSAPPQTAHPCAQPCGDLWECSLRLVHVHRDVAVYLMDRSTCQERDAGAFLSFTVFTV